MTSRGKRMLEMLTQIEDANPETKDVTPVASQQTVFSFSRTEGDKHCYLKTAKSRKRKRNISAWKRDVSKARKLHGESYISSRGQYVPGASLKDPCPTTCRRDCRNLITREERLNWCPPIIAEKKLKRKYLYPDLNITIMYEMYKKYREDQKLEIGSAGMYRKIFCEEYNLGFFRPKKDQYGICMAYNTPGSDQVHLEAEYRSHLAAKDRALQKQRSYKENSAKSQGKSFCCNFDLQQVLLVPCNKTNDALFYKQQLKTYNFIIYNTVTSSHVFDSSPKINHLKTIDLKFLVKGHSEMECDSMHAAIATEFKRIGTVTIPSDWKIIARSARRRGDNPYLVNEISHQDIFDWKKYSEQAFIFRKDVNKVTVSWQKYST
nr:unnamed protein product [Callosobruchus analis]